MANDSGKITSGGFLTFTMLLVGSALVLGSASTASADMCFEESTSAVLVAKGFTLPAKGACKPVDGYVSNTVFLISGNACGTSDNQGIRFGLYFSNPDGTPYFGSYNFTLSRSTLSGSGVSCNISAGPCSPRSFAKVPCPTVTLP